MTVGNSSVENTYIVANAMLMKNLAMTEAKMILATRKPARQKSKVCVTIQKIKGKGFKEKVPLHSIAIFRCECLKELPTIIRH